MGFDELPDRECRRSTAERMAQPCLWAEELLHGLRRAVHRQFAAVWPCAQSRSPDLLSNIARHRRRGTGAGRTSHPGGHFSGGKTTGRFRAIQHGDCDGACGGSAARWMDHRQFFMAMGISYQHSHRDLFIDSDEPSALGSPRIQTGSRGGQASREAEIDYVGILLVAIGFACLEVVLDRGQMEDWLESTFITGFLAIAVVAIVAAI